jgi:hypothetical protein
LAEHWKKDGGVEISIPADILKEPGDYRIRARRRDATGRCSHWSAPVAVRVAE